MKYATFIWDGTRPKKRFTSKEEAIAWIEEEMQGWIAPGDSLESYSTDKGLVFFVETEHGDITDAWATLRIIGEPQCKQQH